MTEGQYNDAQRDNLTVKCEILEARTQGLCEQIHLLQRANDQFRDDLRTIYAYISKRLPPGPKLPTLTQTEEAGLAEMGAWRVVDFLTSVRGETPSPSEVSSFSRRARLCSERLGYTVFHCRRRGRPATYFHGVVLQFIEQYGWSAKSAAFAEAHFEIHKADQLAPPTRRTQE